MKIKMAGVMLSLCAVMGPAQANYCEAEQAAYEQAMGWAETFCEGGPDMELACNTMRVRASIAYDEYYACVLREIERRIQSGPY